MPTITDSAINTWFSIICFIVLYGVSIVTSHDKFKYTLCNVWFIPCDVNSETSFVSTFPTLAIFICIFGPCAENSLSPNALPKYMNISEVFFS